MDEQLRLGVEPGEQLRVLIVTRDAAKRFWVSADQAAQLMLVGLIEPNGTTSPIQVPCFKSRRFWVTLEKFLKKIEANDRAK